MDGAATLVWIAPEPPDPQQSRSLSNWSQAHGVKLGPPGRGVAPALPVDLRIGDGVETLLDRARDAIAARDGDGAERFLSSAESLLRAHPELPHAAWLMAEIERARAARWRRISPADIEAAESAWLRAEALDGGRVAGVGEEGSPNHPPAATVALDLLPDDAHPLLDGKPVQGRVIATRAGTHAFVLTRAGVPLWAAWIDVYPGSSSIHAQEPLPPGCSVVDVARAQAMPDTIDASHVRCPAWIAAVAGARPGSVRLASCETDRCGPLFEWQAPAPWLSPAAEPAQGRRWPGWATWSLVGASAALATSAVILLTGVLAPAPSETRFVSGGIKTQ